MPAALAVPRSITGVGCESKTSTTPLAGGFCPAVTAAAHSSQDSPKVIFISVTQRLIDETAPTSRVVEHEATERKGMHWGDWDVVSPGKNGVADSRVEVNAE